jgi:hypothetical protein
MVDRCSARVWCHAKTTSPRTTIPISMVRQWKLKPILEWEVRDDKMVAVVIKHKDKPKQIFKKQQ